MSPDEITGLHVAIGKLQTTQEGVVAALGRVEKKLDDLPCSAHSERMAVMETRMRSEGARAGSIMGGIVAGAIAGAGFVYKLITGQQ